MAFRRIALCVLFFCGYLAFAQNGSNELGISDDELKQMINKYLVDTFSRYLRRNDLRVSELSVTTDWNASTTDKDLNYYNVQARFRNFPINSRILSGRLETNVAVRKRWLRGPTVEQRKDQNISLFVDDQLSDDLRDALVRDYVMKNYEDPLDVDIKKEKVQIYPDKIYSYVSCMVNRDRIVYLRAVFDRNPPRVENVGGVFAIHETPWQLNRAEVLFSKRIPDMNDRKARDQVGQSMFEQIKGFHEKNVKSRVFNKGGSKIESISKTDLKEANQGMIKVEWDVTYLLDWWFFLSQKYHVKIFVFFQFDFDKEEWVYMGIENIKDENIRVLK